jgi:hypothetical protein
MFGHGTGHRASLGVGAGRQVTDGAYLLELAKGRAGRERFHGMINACFGSRNASTAGQRC